MQQANVDSSTAQPIIRASHFYANIVLLNKDEVVQSKVQEKAGKGLFGKAASFAATSLVTEDSVIAKYIIMI
jgi:hypothetical protein